VCGSFAFRRGAGAAIAPDNSTKFGPLWNHDRHRYYINRNKKMIRKLLTIFFSNALNNIFAWSISLKASVVVDVMLALHQQKLLNCPIANILYPNCWITVIDDHDDG
jgi:hypothetical protein